MPRACSMAMVTVAFLAACRREATPAPVPVPTETKAEPAAPNPPGAPTVIATDPGAFALYRIPNAVLAIGSKGVAHLAGGTVEPMAPIVFSTDPKAPPPRSVSMHGWWPHPVMSAIVGEGCRAPIFSIQGWDGTKWSAESVPMGASPWSTSWGDGRAIAGSDWYGPNGKEAGPMPTLSPAAFPGCAVDDLRLWEERDLPLHANGWTVVRGGKRCDGGYESVLFVWAPGALEGKPLPSLEHLDELIGLAAGKNGPIFALTKTQLLRLDGDRWVAVEGAPAAPKAIVASASGTLLVQTDEGAAGNALHARDRAGMWTVVTLQDPRVGTPVTIDGVAPLESDLYVSAHGPKGAAIFHGAI